MINMSMNKKLDNETKAYFLHLIRAMTEGGVWVCENLAYRVSHKNKTFTLFSKIGESDLQQMNAKFIPQITGYKVIEALENRN